MVEIPTEHVEEVTQVVVDFLEGLIVKMQSEATVSRGIRCPIIREGDNLAKIVADRQAAL